MFARLRLKAGTGNPGLRMGNWETETENGESGTGTNTNTNNKDRLFYYQSVQSYQKT